MSEAKQRFHLGDRVRLSPEGRQEQRYRRSLERGGGKGEVVGFGREGNSIYVQREGLRTRESFPHRFWERVECEVKP